MNDQINAVLRQRDFMAFMFYDIILLMETKKSIQ